MDAERDPYGLTRGGIEIPPDMVNHPPHYTGHVSGVECITLSEWLGFSLGNAFKYLWRCEEKGAREQDLRKALWYLERAAAHPETLPNRPIAEMPSGVIAAYYRWADASDQDSPIFQAMVYVWLCQYRRRQQHLVEMLDYARQCVTRALETTR